MEVTDGSGRDISDAAVDSSRQQAASRNVEHLRVQRTIKFAVRVLFRYLEKVDPKTLVLAKIILRDCERNRQANISQFGTLSGAINERLRNAVGEVHWDEAWRIYRQVIGNRRSQPKRMNGVESTGPVPLRGGSPAPATMPSEDAAEAARMVAPLPVPILSKEDGHSQASDAGRAKVPLKRRDQRAQAESPRQGSLGRAPQDLAAGEERRAGEAEEGRGDAVAVGGVLKRRIRGGGRDDAGRGRLRRSFCSSQLSVPRRECASDQKTQGSGGGREDEQGRRAPTAHGSSLTYPPPTSVAGLDNGNVLGMIIELV